MFKKILIANRGEIACRVMVTAKKMGIADRRRLCPKLDKDARHVGLADEAVLLGPAPSRESYLVADKIIAAGQEPPVPRPFTRATASSPRTKSFAKRQLEEEGLVFIGPKHYSIAAHGRQDRVQEARATRRKSTPFRVGTKPSKAPERAVEIAQAISATR